MHDWIPSITSTGLIAGVLYLFRKLISVRLTQSVKNEFDTKLAELNSELRAKESQINALQSGALSGLISRQSKIYEKQIEAVEQIWDAKSKLSKYISLVSTMGMFKFDESSKESVKNPEFRRVFDIVGMDLEYKDLNFDLAIKCRPFISELSWAYYSAYQTIISSSYLKMDVLRKGIENPKQYFNFNGGDRLLKTVLPHHSELIDKYSDGSQYAFFLEEIEKLLLLELKSMLSGDSVDKENAQKAASILRETKELAKSDNQKESSFN